MTRNAGNGKKNRTAAGQAIAPQGVWEMSRLVTGKSMAQAAASEGSLNDPPLVRSDFGGNPLFLIIDFRAG